MPSAMPGSSPAPAPRLLPCPGPVRPQTSVSLSGHCARAGRQLSIVTAPRSSDGAGDCSTFSGSSYLPSQGRGSLRWHPRPSRTATVLLRAAETAAPRALWLGWDMDAISAVPASPSSALSRRQMERFGISAWLFA